MCGSSPLQQHMSVQFDGDGDIRHDGCSMGRKRKTKGFKKIHVEEEGNKARKKKGRVGSGHAP